ncbi:MAG: UPF0182 family protein [Deltaproteobacteria bacterium]|nr:MAG: UPF0182 family protein [Deltaproteobacteria bacterium]
MKQFTILVLFLVLIAVVVAFTALSGFLVDWLWFDALGFGTVFITVWKAKAAAFGIAAGVSWVVLAGNGLLAARIPTLRVRQFRLVLNPRDREGLPEVIEFSPETLPWRTIVLVFATVLSLVLGLVQASHWEVFLKWRHAVPFERVAPVLGQDLGFYIFALPVYGVVRDWALLIIILAALSATGVYWGRGAIDLQPGFPQLGAPVIRHLSALVSLFFLVKAGDYLLQRYALLLSNNEIVFGAAYTDVQVRLPLLLGLAGLSLIATALCAANLVFLSIRLPVVAAVVVFGVSGGGGIVPSLFQGYRVKPDELRLESPYIAHTIAATRYGFGLEQISRLPFPAAGALTPEVVAANSATIQNIRWWDPRPLLETYRQLQEIRLYYDFHDVDVDRYTLNGTYQQVLLSGRELNQSRLSPEAQTWINQHFKFTHGYGLAMSPVNRFDEEGLPLFYLKDIPPLSPMALRIDRPELYFGEQADTYVVVEGGTTEFDYPKGQENMYTTYHGRDGVSLGNMWRRALFAWYFGDVKLLISGNVTASSRMLFRRLIQDRIRRIAPFLQLDRDPYLTISDGRLIWVQDAYTVSDRLPYSQRNRPGGINYIRNAVKVVVDAYDGTPVFYIADPQDPLVRTYQRIFPSLFQPLEQMPASLRAHIRYPEDLFSLQASMYSTYHMTDPEVFYNKEDLWNFPQETYNGKPVFMQPYYTIMRLPGEAREEFILMLPMVPRNRDNMIAWLAARCDGTSYGEILEFAFSKEKLVYGPAQIEARIDQDTTISQQLSLWNQTGSRVIRGNLLVIPIEDAVLYVEPLYLSAESRELPELKRLIASSGDRVVMSQNVDSLLAALLTKEPGQSPVVMTPRPPGTPPPAAALPSSGTTVALQHYRQALDALRKGDWQTFGVEMDALQKALEGATAAPPS